MRLFLLVLLTSFSTFAHDYFFAFGEIVYNETSKKFETTLSVSTHDLESGIKKEGIKIADFSNIEKGSTDFAVLEKYLLKHFQLKSNTGVKLNLLGFKISLEGKTDFFLESEVIEINNTVEIFYDLLMNHNEKQQNKITFYYKKESYTRPFLITQKSQSIKLY